MERRKNKNWEIIICLNLVSFNCVILNKYGKEILFIKKVIDLLFEKIKRFYLIFYIKMNISRIRFKYKYYSYLNVKED